MASRPVSASLQEYARGVGGGLLFSLPMLYTMEVWAVGLATSPERLLVVVAGTFALLLAYNHVAGIRDEHTLREELLESVEEMGLGLLVAAGLLALLGRLPDAWLSVEALGLVTVEGMIAAIGVSVGTAQLGQAPEPDSEASGDSSEAPDSPAARLFREAALTVCGAVLIAANVAPTDEVWILAVEMAPGALLGLVALSVAVGGGLLYFSAFRGADRLAALGRRPVRGTVVTYAVALLVSAALLGVFGQFDVVGPAAMPRLLAVLGFPAMLGASAGRLLLSPSD